MARPQSLRAHRILYLEEGGVRQTTSPPRYDAVTV
jgi:hypothetical protein